MGWLALIVPCPVCVTVIFFTLAFLISFFPDAVVLTTLFAYGGFIVLHTLTIVGLKVLTRKSASPPELTLGGAMFIVAVYFLLSVFIMPQFSDLDKIYRLAAYQAQEQVVDSRHLVYTFFALGICFFLGFLFKKLKKGKQPVCK
jgi:predicted transporter